LKAQISTEKKESSTRQFIGGQYARVINSNEDVKTPAWGGKSNALVKAGERQQTTANGIQKKQVGKEGSGSRVEGDEGVKKAEELTWAHCDTKIDEMKIESVSSGNEPTDSAMLSTCVKKNAWMGSRQPSEGSVIGEKSSEET